jgi:hypothetical protein
MTENPGVTFAKVLVEGLPIIGEHIILDRSKTIDLENVPLNGGFLTKTLILRYIILLAVSFKSPTPRSPEPYLRERMRDPSIPSYSPTFILGARYIISLHYPELFSHLFQHRWVWFSSCFALRKGRDQPRRLYVRTNPLGSIYRSTLH